MKPTFPLLFKHTSKLMLTLVLLSFMSLASAQNPFPEIPTLITGMIEGDATFVDYDNDGDQDLCLNGFTVAETYRVSLYENLGGSFAAPDTLPGTAETSMAWFDYDNDNDLDLLINGTVDFTTPTTILYRNDGGTFTAVPTSFPNLEDGSISAFDADNNGTIDVFMSGADGNGNASAQLYLNTNGTFAPSGNSFLPLFRSFSTAGDIDNDGDIDLFYCGVDGPGTLYSRIYTNDHGVFTHESSGIIDMRFASGDFGDYDGDGDLDLVVSGRTNGGREGVIYTNNGAGTFTALTSSPIDSLTNGSSVWGDIDNDGDLDLLSTGSPQVSGPTTSLYLNNGGQFTDVTAPFTGVEQGAACFGDYDGDGKLDVFVTGTDNTAFGTSKLYHNEVTTVTANANPLAPTGLSISSPADSVLEFTWTAPTDDFTPSAGLNYQLVIGTSSGDDDVSSPSSNLATGYHRISSYSSIQGTTWRLHTPTCGVTYYAKVQAIDGMYEGSAFSAEASHRYPFTTATTFADPTITVTDGAICDSVRWWSVDLQAIVPGATGSSFTIPHNGTYAAIMYRFGCVDTTDSYSFFIHAADPSLSGAAVVFPNPARSEVTMRLPQGNNIAEVTVHDMQGRITGAAVRIKANEANCSLDGLAPGIYLLKATTRQGAKVATATFVKQ